jgi:hypothetical protein
VDSKFGVGVGRLEWLEDENLWSLVGLDGQNLGRFQGVVASDKNIVSPRFTNVTGRPPPLGTISLLQLFCCVQYFIFASRLDLIVCKNPSFFIYFNDQGLYY